jgi:hypothetical protein
MTPRFLVGLLSVAAFAQTTPTPTACPAGTANTPYSYWAGSGVGYDLFGKLPSVRTFFAVKAGECSNVFLETLISTGVGANNPTPGYAMLSERLNYQVAAKGPFSFEGHGQVGVIQQTTSGANTVTTAAFGGGAGLGFDIGQVLSKGKISLPIVFSADYIAAPAAAAPAGAVKPSYSIDIRKTF